MLQPLIQLNGIARDFSDGRQIRRVLKKMDLSIYPGELTILAGPSGSGKTTLLSIMGLLLKPSEGQIFIGDREVSLSSENARATMRMKYYGFVFQLADIIPSLLQRVLAWTDLALDFQSELVRVGLPDLIQYPIFDLKNNEPNAVRIQDKVRFFTLYVRKIPRQV